MGASRAPSIENCKMATLLHSTFSAFLPYGIQSAAEPRVGGVGVASAAVRDDLVGLRAARMAGQSMRAASSKPSMCSLKEAVWQNQEFAASRDRFLAWSCGRALFERTRHLLARS